MRKPPSPITGISITAFGLPANTDVTVSLAAQYGAVTISSAVAGGLTSNQISNNGTSNVIVTATLAEINSTLAASGGLTYTPPAIVVASDELGITASDGLGDTSTALILLTLGNGLTINVPSPAQTLPANTASAIQGVSLDDPGGLPTANTVATFSVANGTLSFSTNVPGGLTASQILGNGSSILTILAPVAAINATLAADHGLVYDPNSGYVGADNLCITAEDSLQHTAACNVAIGVVGALTINVPTTTLSVPANGQNEFGITLSAAGAPDNEMISLTLSAANGAIDFDTYHLGGGNIWIPVQVRGAGTNSVTVTGSLADVNMLISQTVYTPFAGYTGPDTVSIAASDPFGQFAVASVSMLTFGPLTITVPTIPSQVAGAQTVPIAGVSVTDPGLPTTHDINFEIATSGGSLILATNIPGGVTADEVSYLGPLVISIEATLAEINATLAAANGLSYKALQGFNGSDSVQFFASDSTNVSNFAQIPLQISSPPEIRKVAVDSTGWSQGFEQQFSSHNVNPTPGYILPAGQTQLTDLPWSGLNEIRVQFTEDLNVQQDSLTVTGLTVPQYAISGFSYDVSSHVATWTLAQPIGADRVQIHLASTGPYAVTDLSGNPLDGEWTDHVSAFPSGDGQAGGDFNFSFNVLPGDVNQDGIVNTQDLALVSSTWLASLQTGVFNGFPWIDPNGDGIVNSQDLAIISASWMTSLPAQATGTSSATSMAAVSAMALSSGASQPAAATATLAASAEANPAVTAPTTVAAASIAVENITSTSDEVVRPSATLAAVQQPASLAPDNMPTDATVTAAPFGSAATTISAPVTAEVSGPQSSTGLAAVINTSQASPTSNVDSSSPQPGETALGPGNPAPIIGPASRATSETAWDAALLDYATGADNFAAAFESELATLLTAPHRKPLAR